MLTPEWITTALAVPGAVRTAEWAVALDADAIGPWISDADAIEGRLQIGTGDTDLGFVPVASALAWFAAEARVKIPLFTLCDCGEYRVNCACGGAS